MRIVSRTTTEYRVRSLLFLGMCLAFAGWFGYDGMWGYPAKNLNWAQQYLPEKPTDLKTNPRVVKSNLDRIQEIITSEGMTLEQVKARLGPPALVHENDYWFVGPATYARITVDDEKAEALKFEENPQKSETDIRGQKGLASILLVVALIFAVRLVAIAGRKTVLDDQGVSVRGRRVAWEQMSGLNTSNYDRKGWLDLEYRHRDATRTLRLDSYHIARFDEIINEICARKNFESPILPDDDNDDDEMLSDAR